MSKYSDTISNKTFFDLSNCISSTLKKHENIIKTKQLFKYYILSNNFFSTKPNTRLINNNESNKNIYSEINEIIKLGFFKINFLPQESNKLR